jgi:hypothetical protein
MSMKKIAAALAVALILPLALVMLAGGCGGNGQMTTRDGLVDYAVRSIIIPAKQQPQQLVVLQRYPVDDPSPTPEAINEKMWKIENGTITEISLEEYNSLKSERIDNDNLKWAASEHSIRIFDLNEENGTAVIEVDTIYGPLSGAGIVYKLEFKNGAWNVVEKATAWVY